MTATFVKYKRFFEHPTEMTQKKIRVHLFKSTLCPRCHHTEKLLNQIANQRTDLEICKVDIMRHPLLSLQNRVFMIPTLIMDNNERLSGLFLSQKRLRSFLEENT